MAEATKRRPGGANQHTRRGNGAGWGGPKRGEGKPFEPGDPRAGRPDGVKHGEGKQTVADIMVARGAREIAAQRWLEILADPAHPKHAEMVAKAADRMDGAPKTSIHITERDPNSMTDAELASIASRGRSAAFGPEDAAE